MFNNLGNVNKLLIAIMCIIICSALDSFPIIMIKLALEMVVLGALCVIVWVVSWLNNDKEKTTMTIQEQLNEVYGKKWNDKEGKYVKD